MSGVGKSTVGSTLAARGFKVADLDYGYSTDDGHWNEDLVDELLSIEDGDVLFVIGAADNQPKFYPRFDLIVLLSAPVDVMLARLNTRTNNRYGKSAEDQAKIRSDLRQFEPLMRRVADHELRTDSEVQSVVADLVRLVKS
jgi:shikimate kinase